MYTNDLVSVVIPTYFRNDELRVAVRSALDQSYDHVEVIVVDDSGERHAQDVVSEFPDVEYHATAGSQGPQRARMAGLDIASGAYVQFLDDDDSLASEKLERQIPVLEANEDVGVVYCGLQWEDGLLVRPKTAVRGDVLADVLRFDTAPCMMGTMLIERDALDRISMAKHTHAADDIGMKIELARVTKFEYVDEILVTRGDTPGSLSTSREAIEGRFAIIDMYADLYDDFPPAVRREALAETYLVQGQRCLAEQSWSLSAISSFARATYYIPHFDIVYVGALLTSLLGRPGYEASRTMYRQFVLSQTRRGKNI